MTTPASHSDRRQLPALSAVFAAAIAIRVLHLIQILPAPFFPFLMGDAAAYDQWAARVAAGAWIEGEVFYQAPLYPYFLAVVYRFLASDLFAVRLIQAILGSLACTGLAWAGMRWFDRATGIVAGLLLAAYAPAIFFDSLIQKSVLDALFLCWLLALLAGDRLYVAGVVGLGLLMGGLILTRENALALVPPMIAWLAWRANGTWRHRTAAVVVFAGSLAAVLLPVAARNYWVGGEFHLTTSQFGPNFYIGNNARANGQYAPLRPHRGSARYERQDATELAEANLGRELTPAEVSRYWTGRALQFIRQQPSDWLKLLGRKTALTFNAAEVVDTEDQYTYAEYSWPLKLFGHVWHFGVALPLAVAGVWMTWSRRREMAILYALFLFYAASIVLFYVFGRYRYPLVPLLILWAAAAVTHARTYWTSHRPAHRLGLLAVVALSAVAANWPLVSIDAMRATTHYNVGVELDAIGDYAAAEQQYRRALQFKPDYSDVHNNLGSLLRNTGRLEQAVRHLEQALAAEPGFPEARYNLAATFLELQDDARALAQFQLLVSEHPRMPQAWLGVGIVLSRRGDISGARSALQKALELDPELQPARRALEQLPGE